MLDNDTKRRIDAARDTLVGKVPDPKSQVEQITIALIYKFMADMDNQAESVGGKRSFFAGAFESYRWENLMSPGLGGHEVLRLYTEAVVKMNANPGVPQLFRDIFKNAYLPYRDPETLRGFLKIIDDFQYDHSERLGDAFEYLLSVLGSQGDAGQFRTPRHIIDFMVDIIAPQNNEVILDPACGTAGFLISAWKFIRAANAKGGKPGAALSPDQRRKLARNIFGYDISPDMVRLSLVNMYLHGFAEPHIHEYDALTSDDRWNETADVILANPPFMTPKGGIRPHGRFSIQARRSEVLFVDYIAEHLSAKGRAAVIVPEGIIFQSAGAYKNLRKMLVENYIVAVVSLPAGVFNPYSGVKTSILFMDKSLAKKAHDMLFVKVENDGYDLGAQRRRIEKNDLPEAARQIKAYFDAVKTGAVRDMENPAGALVVAREKVNESADWNLNGELYREVEDIRQSDWPVVALGEVCDIQKGTSITKKQTKAGDVPVIAGGQKPAYFHNVSNREGDTVTVSGSGYAGFVNFFSIPIFASDCTTIKAKDGMGETKFVYYLLKEKQEMIYALRKGMAQPHVYPKDLKRFKVPFPPLAVQREILAEINAYQKIINGARQVVENYTPHISIDPTWPVVKLGDVCQIFNGTTPSTAVADYWDGDIVWITPADLGKLDGINIYSSGRKITEDSLKATRLKLHPVGTVVLSSRAPIGHLGIAKIPLCTNQGCKSFIPSDDVNSEFLYFVLQSHVSDFQRLGSGSTFKEISKSKLERFQISLPPIQIQEEMVAEIAREMELVNANKLLVAIFERKIKTKIAAVWGEQ